jgi:hypothetical protein
VAWAEVSWGQDALAGRGERGGKGWLVAWAKRRRKVGGEQGRPGLDRKGRKRILAQGRRRKIFFLWIKEFGIRFKGFLKRGLRGEFREEFKRIQRSLRRTPTERLRRDSLRL